VYGPGASGNIARLVNLIDTGVPLPFKNAANARSMISVSNLAKAIVHVGEMQGRGPHIFNATDVTLSTFELVAHLARGMGRKVRCFSVPRAALSLTRRSPARSIVDRLWGDFALDSSALRRTGWRPELSAIEELYQTARYLMENRTR
jgi:nucleoside-diphosphate-sugar epimerase